MKYRGKVSSSDVAFMHPLKINIFMYKRYWFDYKKPVLKIINVPTFLNTTSVSYDGKQKCESVKYFFLKFFMLCMHHSF